MAESLGAWLRAELLRQGLSQEILAAAAGLNRVVVGAYIRGENWPSDEGIARLCVALGCEDQAPLLIALRASDQARAPRTAHRQRSPTTRANRTPALDKRPPQRAVKPLKDPRPR